MSNEETQSQKSRKEIMPLERRANYEQNLRANIALQNYPQNAKRYFSGKNMDMLRDLVNSEDIIQLDLLKDFGELQDDETMEYFVNLPEFQNQQKRLKSTIDNFFSFIKPGLKKKVQDCMPNQTGRFNVYPIIEILEQISIFCGSQRSGVEQEFFRALLTGSFELRLVNKIIQECHTIISQLPYPFEVKNTVFIKLREMVSEYIQNHYKSDLPFFRFLDFNERIKNTVKSNPKGYNNLVQGNSESQSDADEKFDTILELEPLVRTDKITKQIGNAKIEIRGLYNNLDPVSRAFTAYEFRITLDPDFEEEYTPHSRSLSDGRKTTGFQISEKYFEGVIERNGGIVSLTPNVPYSLFLGEQNYQKMRNAIFDAILEHLNSADIIPPQLSQNVRENISHTYNKPSDEQTETAPTENQPEQAKDPISEPQHLDAEAENKKFKKQLRGLKGNRVLAALQSMVKLVRVSGSHHIFKGRSGNTYPIAIHGDKNVGTGMLLACLEKYGISIREFAERV